MSIVTATGFDGAQLRCDETSAAYIAADDELVGAICAADGVVLELDEHDIADLEHERDTGYRPMVHHKFRRQLTVTGEQLAFRRARWRHDQRAAACRVARTALDVRVRRRVGSGATRGQRAPTRRRRSASAAVMGGSDDPGPSATRGRAADRDEQVGGAS